MASVSRQHVMALRYSGVQCSRKVVALHDGVTYQKEVGHSRSRTSQVDPAGVMARTRRVSSRREQVK